MFFTPYYTRLCNLLRGRGCCLQQLTVVYDVILYCGAVFIWLWFNWNISCGIYDIYDIDLLLFWNTLLLVKLKPGLSRLSCVILPLNLELIKELAKSKVGKFFSLIICKQLINRRENFVPLLIGPNISQCCWRLSRNRLFHSQFSKWFYLILPNHCHYQISAINSRNLCILSIQSSCHNDWKLI